MCGAPAVHYACLFLFQCQRKARESSADFPQLAIETASTNYFWLQNRPCSQIEYHHEQKNGEGDLISVSRWCECCMAWLACPRQADVNLAGRFHSRRANGRRELPTRKEVHAKAEPKNSTKTRQAKVECWNESESKADSNKKLINSMSGALLWRRARATRNE